jgi:hypothetical protein
VLICSSSAPEKSGCSPAPGAPDDRAIALINFAQLRFKIAVTRDFATWRAIEHLEQLKTLDWLDNGLV